MEGRCAGIPDQGSNLAQSCQWQSDGALWGDVSSKSRRHEFGASRKRWPSQPSHAFLATAVWSLRWRLLWCLPYLLSAQTGVTSASLLPTALSLCCCSSISHALSHTVAVCLTVPFPHIGPNWSQMARALGCSPLYLLLMWHMSFWLQIVS